MNIPSRLPGGSPERFRGKEEVVLYVERAKL